MGLCYGGCPFWEVGKYWELIDGKLRKNWDLVALEWDGNEININHSPDLLTLVIHAMGIVKAWKEQMERSYNHIPFDSLLFLSGCKTGYHSRGSAIFSDTIKKRINRIAQLQAKDIKLRCQKETKWLNDQYL